MSERDEKPSVIRDAPRLPSESEGGVDLWQIRRLLKLTPAERLRVGVENANTAVSVFGLPRR